MEGRELKRRDVGGFVGYDGAVYGDAAVRTNGCAGGTTDAGFLSVGESEMITAVVDLLGLKCKHIFRTCHHAQVASLTTLAVNLYSSCYSWHLNDFELYVMQK